MCFVLIIQLCGMDQFWGIALRAHSGDVSRAAIQYINSYYINGENEILTVARDRIQIVSCVCF